MCRHGLLSVFYVFAQLLNKHDIRSPALCCFVHEVTVHTNLIFWCVLLYVLPLFLVVFLLSINTVFLQIKNYRSFG